MSRTPPPADHEAYDQLAVGWALHALEPEDEAAFARHLPDCPRCARTVAETEEVMAALATDLPQAEPSENLRARLRAAVERTEQVHRPPVVPEVGQVGQADAGSDVPDADLPARPPTSGTDGLGEVSFRSLRRRAPVLALAAALVGVVAMGIWNVSLAEDRERATTVAAEQSAVVEELLRPGAEVVAQLAGENGAVATVIARDGDLQVVSQGLSVNDDAAETYVLWGLQDGTPVAVGTFDVVRSRLDLHAVGSAPTGSGDFDQYALSLEPGRQPPAAPSEVLAIGQVTS